MSNPNPPDNGEASEIADSIHYQTEGPIHIYSIQTVEKGAIEQWIKHVINVLENSPVNKPLMLVYDLSDSPRGGSYLAFTQYFLTTPGFTTEGNARVGAFMDEHPDFKICLATVLNPTLSGRATRTALAHTPGRERISDKIFFTRESALNWLRRIAQSTEATEQEKRDTKT